MSGHDIFISYSRDDRSTARQFAQCFEAEGLTVWWDAALQAGETFDEVIEAELKAAGAVVVLWSPRSVSSRWVRAEATMADRRKKLAPVIIEDCDLPIIFELSHTANLSDWDGIPSHAGWQAFVRDVRRVVERGQSASSRVAEPPQRRRAAVNSPPSPQLARPMEVKPAPAPVAVATSESEATQFYSRADGFDLLGDQFHCLEVRLGDKLEQRHVVNPLGLKIGRTAPADIVLADARVSRTHCVIELADDRLRVRDLNSTNGTFIDGKRVHDQGWLEVGSVLRVGNVSFTHAVRTRADV